MKKKILNLLQTALLPLASCLLPKFCLLPAAANAQIIPDNTLPNNTIVAPNGQTINIEGGTRSGGNLFHSFQEFNLGNGSTAFFNNAADIQNILSRVTGGNISNIDGLIRANGGANLFLVNPAGIVFGPNARLDIGGSFLASSAESVIFNDGSFFSATEPNAPPLLTVNVPIGLQMGTNPGAILVEGTGHKLRRDSELLPIDRSEQLRAPLGLQVQPGNTLTIVGGDVTLDGGVLSALEGQIELGSVRQGLVGIEPSGNLGYENAQQFGDILMVSKALLDTSSIPGSGSAGSIRIQGQNLEMRGGSQVVIQNLGAEPSGNLSVNARGSINLIGTAPESGELRSAFATETLGRGDGGELDIVTARLLLSDGGGIGTFNQTQEILSPPRGGNINIEASESVEIIGFSPILNTRGTIIGAISFGTGRAGNVTVTTPLLRLVDGGSLSSSPTGQGVGGGDLTANADTIEVIGFRADGFGASSINVVNFSQGESGNLIINTRSLIVKDGGRLGGSTFSTGAAGRVTINASEFVELTNIEPGDANPSFIGSSAVTGSETFQQIGLLPPVPTGDTGEVTINTPRLRVADGSLVAVRHEGTGNAGALRINAGSVLLENGGSITAASASGLGGNVVLNVGDSILLRDGGSITAQAGGAGDGGNLTINTETIALLRNSTIDANAFEGSGGNIRIVTEGLFPSADSAITASSQLGVDGTVEVEGLDNEASKGLVQVSSNLPNLTALIASGCEEYAGSEYIITGRGGLPPTPSEAIALSELWQDWRGEGKRQEARGNRQEIPNSQLVEATGWVRRPDGGIELVANMGNAENSWHQFPSCHNN